MQRNPTDQEELDEEPPKFLGVPQYIMDFLSDFINHVKHKVKRPEGKQLIAHALVNLDFHPLLPKTFFVIQFRHEEITYSVIYTDYKIELSDYHSLDTGFGYDHFQTFNLCYFPSGAAEVEGNFDEFVENIYFAMESIDELCPVEEW